MPMPRESNNFNNFDEFTLEGDLNVLVEHFESVGLTELTIQRRIERQLWSVLGN
jgi:hypothetical protein